MWHRPTNCDIIPLAKLQTLKQNTEVREEEDAPNWEGEILEGDDELIEELAEREIKLRKMLDPLRKAMRVRYKSVYE